MGRILLLPMLVWVPDVGFAALDLLMSISVDAPCAIVDHFTVAF